MTQITNANANLLFEVRSAVDGPFTPADFNKVRREVQKYAQGGDRVAYVVLDGDTAVGYVECMLEEKLPAECSQSSGFKNTGHVARIGVVKERRVRGLGKQLMAQAESWLQTQGRTGAWLDYRHQNWDLTAFYARVGYRKIFEVDDKTKNCMREIAVKNW